METKNLTLELFLHRAIVQNSLESVKIILEKGADINAILDEEHNLNALHIAIFEEHTEIAKLLIEKGIDINAKEKGNGTALHMAAFFGYYDIAKLLLDKGADINAFAGPEGEGKLPIDAAIDKNHPDIVKLCLTYMKKIEKDNLVSH